MTPILKRIFGRHQRKTIPENDADSYTPYILSISFYLAVILFLGLPMWWFTCSKTRYSLPDLTELQTKLSDPDTRLHLDISVVQLARYDALKSEDDFDQSEDRLTTYCRRHLPAIITTNNQHVSYNIDWRVRRPTHDEFGIFQNHQNNHPSSGYRGSEELIKLEENLTKVHKPNDKFRLFMYLIDEPHYAAYCDPSRPHTYTLGFERFVYLCPSHALKTHNDFRSWINLIKEVLDEVYSDSIDSKKVEKVLSGKMEVLISLLPESIDEPNMMANLATVADKFHRVSDKNVRNRYPELKELVNVSTMTQYVVDLIGGQISLGSDIKKSQSNKTEGIDRRDLRIIQKDQINQILHSFDSRLNKHSSQNVHNVLAIIPDTSKSRLAFKGEPIDSISYLEVEDMNSMLIAEDDRSIVLGSRAIVRRAMGLASVNICNNCLVRRDIFFNRWELDALMGTLTMIKLQNVLLSLNSMSQQAIGIRIPKNAAATAEESYQLAIQSIEHLATKQVLIAYRLASQAYMLSETAYFDQSLLESLYFPDDLKYAIYTPFFGPLVLPLVKSIHRLIDYLKERKSLQKLKSD